MKNQAFAFTLVELIVVITIVWILSTVWFVSYSWYLTWARDSNRFSQLTKLSDSLQTYAASKSLPLPDDYIEITASGSENVMAYQWYVWVDVLETIDYTNGGKDPKDDSYYTYFLTKDRKSIQLLAFMEENPSVRIQSNPQLFAADYSERLPKVYGQKLWVLVSAEDVTFNIPAQEISTITNGSGYLDVVTITESFSALVDNSNKISGSWASLKILENILWEGGFKDSLVAWYDMETSVNSGLRDLSWKNNHATRIGTELIAWNDSGVFWKATNFEWLIWGYEMTNSEILQSNKFSISLWQKTDTDLWVFNYTVAAYEPIINQWDCTNGCDENWGWEWWFWHRLWANNTSELNVIFWSGWTSSIRTTGDNSYADWKWHHNVILKSWNEISLYLDGKHLDTIKSQWVKDIASILPLYIGTSWHKKTEQATNVHIDEVRIYNTTLDTDEIQRMYQVGKNKL